MIIETVSDAAADPGASPAPAGSSMPPPPAQRQGRVGKLAWSLASLVSSYGFRFLSNVVLTHLLAPTVFGTMVVVNALRLGIELLTDVGIEQNIVRHEKGLEDSFFNTAWTMQIVRGIGLTILFLLLAPVLGRFYAVDTRVFLVIAFAPLVNALHSTAVFALVKNLEVKKRTLFEFRAEFTGFVAAVVLALITPTVWALVFGVLIQIATRSILSYFLPHPRHRLVLNWVYVREIAGFGRWIMVSSLLMFAASNLDRLVLGKIAPLALLGIYGLARTMADIPALVARRLTYQIVFPMLSAARARGEENWLGGVGRDRLFLVLGSAVAMGFGAAIADLAIRLLYDPRYLQAGWMLSLLLFATFISMLSNFNEGLLMGSGKPAYESGANIIRFSVMAIGLWLGFRWLGFAGVILALAVAECGRYLFVAFGQARVRASFVRQDALAAGVMLGTFAAITAGRSALGLGTALDMLHVRW